MLTFCNGTWYVRGKAISSGKRNPKHNDFFTFALHRISTAKRNGKSFEPDLEEIAAVNEGQIFDFPRYADVKLKVRDMALRQTLESLPIESVEYKTPDCAEILLKEVEEYKVINFVLISDGNAEILAPAELRQKALQKAEAVVRLLGGK